MSEYEEKSAQIRQLASLPIDGLIDHFSSLHPNVSSVAPNVAPHLHAAAVNAVQFLNSKLPHMGNELPGDDAHTASDLQKNHWMELYNTASDPVSILKHVNHGTMTLSHLEALKTIYPDIHQEMSQKMLEEIGKGTEIPYQKRLSISKFLGMPLDSTMTPGNIQAIINSAGQNRGPEANSQKSHGKASGTELTQINKVNALSQTSVQANRADQVKK